MAYSPKNANGQATMANSEPVVIASDQSAVPVSGTVTANLSATDNAVLDAIESDTTTIAAKDFATQTTLAAMNAKMVSGTDIGDVTINNAAGASAVNIQDGGNSITVDGTVAVSGTVTVGSHAVTNAGTFAVQATGTVDLGATDNAVLDDIAAKLATIDADTSALAAGVSTEYQVDVVGALPAGTNAIGKLAANSGVDIGDVTLTAGTAAIGTLLPPDIDVTTHTNYAKKYYTNAGAVTDGIIWSPAAGKRWHVVSLFIQVSAAATVTLEDDKAGGDDPVLKMELAANSGISIPFPEKYPLASGEDAADLIITTSAGNVYVTCVGYEI